MSEAKESSSWLGIYIAEQILSGFFDNIVRMPNNNPGYDFICGKGFKIDVKSACLMNDRGYVRWLFTIRRNEIPDYFLLLGFNEDREQITPMRVWLIPGRILNSKRTFVISNTGAKLKRWVKYERSIEKAIECCDKMKASA